MPTPKVRISLLLAVVACSVVLASAQEKDASTTNGEATQPPLANGAHARCVVAAQSSCSVVATEIVAEIHTACGWFQWACNIARGMMNQPPDQDAPWVQQRCDTEARKQCEVQLPAAHQ
jgi:hypothetical protein